MSKVLFNLSFSVLCGAIVFAVSSPVVDQRLARFGAVTTIAVEMLFCTAINIRGRQDV